MITKPGWYIFYQGKRQIIIFQVFKHFKNGGCWLFNTLYSHADEERSLKDEEEDNLVFDGSEMGDNSYPLLKYKWKELIFEEIFNGNDYVIGKDYL